MMRMLKNLPGRLSNAMRYSLSGLKHAFIKEESFRIETFVLVLLVVVLALVHWPVWKKVALVGAYMPIIAAELVNSCLEELCDHIQPGRHPMVKAVKDMASAAVLAAIVFAALALAALILA
ncbi:MAG: diacylglycerol kinase [Planctomycetota bacterium]|jgi:diacylglycerol kinase (ATP)|nr:diacylglycerol kinase [Planctomycetota bacterium]